MAAPARAWMTPDTCIGDPHEQLNGSSKPNTGRSEVVIAFGEFTVEEAAELLAQAESIVHNTSTEQLKTKVPEMAKSWAQAVGIAQMRPEPLPKPVPKRDRSIKLPFEKAIQQALADLNLNAPAREMKRRGLVNQGNTCFQNAIMQSVLACPPFLNLLVDISSSVAPTDELLSSTMNFKAWRHMIAFVREFEEPTLAQLQRNSETGKTPKPIRISGYFMDVLSAFQKSRGEQEDALEFLEFFLDYLHSEYEQCGLELPEQCETQRYRSMTSMRAEAASVPLGGEEWAEVGRKGRSSVMRENQVDVVRSPINWLFKGTLRAELKHPGRKQSSITIEPFHCLHLNLDIEQEQGFGATSNKTTGSSWTPRVEDMIRKALSVEIIEGSDPSRSMKRHVSVDSLPIVLTLHLKRFTYHPEHGPVKLTQFVKYPVSLEFPTNLLSNACRADLACTSKDAPQYKLFAVVSHHGKYIVGGHYTCVCRDNKDQWFFFNDEHVTSISEASALKEEAYVLFYIRSQPGQPKQ